MKKNTLIALVNTLSLIVALVVNYLATAKQIFGVSMKDQSEKYFNLFTPAPYAFSIWGFIYLFLLLFLGYQFYQIIRKNLDGSIQQIGYWFAIANFGNALWIIAFMNDLVVESMGVMLVILYSLIRITLKTNMERWHAPAKTIAFVWWPISFYFGWITVATIANASALMIFLGYDGSPLTPQIWTILLMVIATIIYITMIWKRSMREYSLVGVWALIAIAVKNWDNEQSIAYTAVGLALIIFINSGIHGFQNRKTLPFFK
jgi:hypothetical protein